MTVLDHSNTPIDKKDDPNGKCETCGKRKSWHTNDEVKVCKIGKYADAGEMAGTRHSRK